MLFSDSLPQLWLSYAALSCVVLVTGYLGVRLLPLLPRLVLVGVVAGALWMVAPFTLPLLQPGETYSGLAPAIVVMAVGVLQHDGSQVFGALPLLLLGSALGAGVGVLAWRKLRRRGGDDDRSGGRGGRSREGASARTRGDAATGAGERGKGNGRREPVVG